MLHDVVMCVAAPAFVASPWDGQLRGLRAEGFYGHDRRLLHTARLLIHGREPEPIGVQPLGPDRVRFTSVHRYQGDPSDDPTLIVERVRTAGQGEFIQLRNVGTVTRRLRLELAPATDLADIADVTRGRPTPTVPCSVPGDGGGLRWRTQTGRAEVRTVGGAGAPEVTDGPEGGTFAWPRIMLRPGEDWHTRVGVARAGPGRPRRGGRWSRPRRSTCGSTASGTTTVPSP
ncbi:MAG: hypothetical protein JF597_21055 [Streptomyces sp.]|uniref:glycogen debranching N-terminal domain-containing protein n=1 Tax=Streptomyces sp. TaxID=1931 RepID=UPI0025FB8AA5|nr:glycogen debranching N-terminal domain-containing protein [Streptomyces sp.]MBW8795988.1 hypothetical protein [Streptomyces sp.]